MAKEMIDSDVLLKGQKIPTREKVCFGFGILANTLLTGIVVLYLTDYYINTIQIEYELFIIANIIFLFWNALNDVIFGFYADRTRHKLGRRIPYIRYGAPIFAISFIFLWIPLPGVFPGDINLGQAMKFFQLLFGYLFFDTMLTIVILSVVALPPEMSESTDERNSIGFYNTLFGVIGGVAIILVPYIMSLGINVFRIFIIMMAMIGTVAYVILSYGVKERKEIHGTDVMPDISILKEILQTFRNKSFISFLLFNFCVVYMTNLILNFTPFFVNLYGLKSGDSTILLLIFYLGSAFSIIAFLQLGSKMEGRKLIIYSTYITLFGISALFLIDLIFNIVEVYIAIFMLDGFFMGMGIFFYPFISDCIDCDELNTQGRRREGMHFGINALVTKPAEQLATIMGASILFMTHYVQGGTALEQPESAILGLKFMAAVIPVILCILCLLSQVINPLKDEYLKDMKCNILDLHDKKCQESSS